MPVKSMDKVSGLISLIKDSKLIQVGIMVMMIALSLAIMASDQISIFGVVIKSSPAASAPAIDSTVTVPAAEGENQ